MSKVFAMGFDAGKFADNLHAALDGKVVGYTAVVLKDGKKIGDSSGGYAVRKSAETPKEKLMGINVRLGMHSATKTLTAAALIDAILKAPPLVGGSVEKPMYQQMTLDTPIETYLAKSGWTLGPSVKNVTFRMLLTHTSGFPSGSEQDLRSGLETILKYGTTCQLPAPHCYANSNFALCRYLLPAVRGQFGSVSNWGDLFVKDIQKNVLEPAGVKNADIIYSGPSPETRYYSTKPSDAGITATADRSYVLERVGAGWWNLSVLEMATVIDKLRTGAILPGVWGVMTKPGPMNQTPGMYWEKRFKLGTAYNHNGGFSDASGRGGNSVWMSWGGDLVMVLATTSNTPAAPEDIARQCILDATTFNWG